MSEIRFVDMIRRDHRNHFQSADEIVSYELTEDFFHWIDAKYTPEQIAKDFALARSPHQYCSFEFFDLHHRKWAFVISNAHVILGNIVGGRFGVFDQSLNLAQSDFDANAGTVRMQMHGPLPWAKAVSPHMGHPPQDVMQAIYPILMGLNVPDRVKIERVSMKRHNSLLASKKHRASYRLVRPDAPLIRYRESAASGRRLPLHEVAAHVCTSRLGRKYWRRAHRRGDPEIGTISNVRVVEPDPNRELNR